VKNGNSDMGFKLTIMHDEKRKGYHGDSMGILRRNEPLESFDRPSSSHNIASEQAENAGRRQLRLKKSPSQRLSMDTRVILPPDRRRSEDSFLIQHQPVGAFSVHVDINHALLHLEVEKVPPPPKCMARLSSGLNTLADK
jgi:hypothetical protein